MTGASAGVDSTRSKRAKLSTRAVPRSPGAAPALPPESACPASAPGLSAEVSTPRRGALSPFLIQGAGSGVLEEPVECPVCGLKCSKYAAGMHVDECLARLERQALLQVSTARVEREGWEHCAACRMGQSGKPSILRAAQGDGARPGERRGPPAGRGRGRGGPAATRGGSSSRSRSLSLPSHSSQPAATVMQPASLWLNTDPLNRPRPLASSASRAAAQETRTAAASGSADSERREPCAAAAAGIPGAGLSNRSKRLKLKRPRAPSSPVSGGTDGAQRVSERREAQGALSAATALCGPSPQVAPGPPGHHGSLEHIRRSLDRKKSWLGSSASFRLCTRPSAATASPSKS